uniref:phage structural protein n=1 Tax=Anaerococcus mediterraneensis TaxID=1870984 RepID=UPI00093203CC|nr:hypothetical protein [Anaerococcus mediterraneensis]
MVRTYDQDLVSIALGNMFLTGYAEDTKVETEKNEDDVYTTVGIDGTTTYSENADRTAKAKISLMTSSPCLPRIYEIAKNRESFPLSIIDMNDDSENIVCDDCRIIKRPNQVTKKQAEAVEFEVFIPEWK